MAGLMGGSRRGELEGKRGVSSIDREIKGEVEQLVGGLDCSTGEGSGGNVGGIALRKVGDGSGGGGSSREGAFNRVDEDEDELKLRVGVVLPLPVVILNVGVVRPLSNTEPSVGVVFPLLGLESNVGVVLPLFNLAFDVAFPDDMELWELSS